MRWIVRNGEREKSRVEPFQLGRREARDYLQYFRLMECKGLGVLLIHSEFFLSVSLFFVVQLVERMGVILSVRISFFGPERIDHLPSA